MIRCMIVDDEQHAIDLLTNHISKIALLNLQFSTTSSIEAFQYVQQKKIDLIFLDIQMPELDGLQFIRLLGGKSKVIFTTAYAEHALEGYEHNVVDYLLKPILFDRFLKAAQKAISLLSSAPADPALSVNDGAFDDDFIFVKTSNSNKIIRILLQDIEYIEGMGNYLSIYTGTSRIITLLSIKELEAKLPANRFLRIHNSYMVPINKISFVEGNQVHIAKHKLPVGDAYKKAFQNAIGRRVMNGKKDT